MLSHSRTAVLSFCAATAVAAILTLASDAFATFHQEPPGDPGSGGANWIRQDVDCPEPPKQKTFCYQDGREMCAAQYCN